MQTLSLKEQQLRLREDVILQAVRSLLSEKGFDRMTVDEVAAVVGVAKASLYKHFRSKELLAATAISQLLDRALAIVEAQPESVAPIDKLKALVRWSLRQRLAGQVPMLPPPRSPLREALVKHRPFIDRLTRLSGRLDEWIGAAQSAGHIAPVLPGNLVMLTLYARIGDPLADFLRAGGHYSDEQIIEHVTTICFSGLASPPQ